jgi:hypothetical protein
MSLVQEIRSRLRNPPNAVWDPESGRPKPVVAAALPPAPEPDVVIVWPEPAPFVAADEPVKLDDDPVPVFKIRVNDIQRETSRHFGVTRVDLVCQRRTMNLVVPRQVAMYLARILTPRSLPEIGRYFGGRDHTTVMHSVNKIAHLRTIDPDLNDDVLAVAKRLGVESI